MAPESGSKSKLSPKQGYNSSYDNLTVKAIHKPPQKDSERSYQEVIKETAHKYGVSKWLMLAVANCESGYDQSAIGSAGEIGIYQYKKQTFRLFKKLSGKKDLSINNAYDQIELTGWAFSNNKHSHWTCYYHVRN